MSGGASPPATGRATGDGAPGPSGEAVRGRGDRVSPPVDASSAEVAGQVARNGHAVAAAGNGRPTLSDGELLRRSRDGDRAAFGVLVERHHGALTAVLQQRFGRSVPTDDVLQDVFLRALVRLDGFEGRSSFLTWATSIALHRATDLVRRDVRRRRLAPREWSVEPDQVDARGAGDPHAAASLRDETDRARAAMEHLPDTHRLAVTLRVVEGLAYAEVAERLGVGTPLARTWVSRGLQELKRRLDGREVEHE